MKREMIWSNEVQGGTAIIDNITASYLQFVDTRTGEEIFIMVPADDHVEFFTKMKRAVDAALIGPGDPN